MIPLIILVIGLIYLNATRLEALSKRTLHRALGCAYTVYGLALLVKGLAVFNQHSLWLA